jgi:hypothetical protein
MFEKPEGALDQRLYEDILSSFIHIERILNTFTLWLVTFCLGFLFFIILAGSSLVLLRNPPRILLQMSVLFFSLATLWLLYWILRFAFWALRKSRKRLHKKPESEQGGVYRIERPDVDFTTIQKMDQDSFRSFAVIFITTMLTVLWGIIYFLSRDLWVYLAEFSLTGSGIREQAVQFFSTVALFVTNQGVVELLTSLSESEWRLFFVVAPQILAAWITFRHLSALTRKTAEMEANTINVVTTEYYAFGDFLNLILYEMAFGKLQQQFKSVLSSIILCQITLLLFLIILSAII